MHGRFDDLDARLASLDRDLREIAHSVRSTTAVDRPLDVALGNELDALSRASGIETELTMRGDLSTLTQSQKIVVFRVVQESLSNIRKHSDADQATVRVRSTPRFIEVTVTDDGVGFDSRRAIAASATSDRLGLAGVTERVRLLGGDVEIEPRPATAQRCARPFPTGTREPRRARRPTQPRHETLGLPSTRCCCGRGLRRCGRGTGRRRQRASAGHDDDRHEHGDDDDHRRADDHRRPGQERPGQERPRREGEARVVPHRLARRDRLPGRRAAARSTVSVRSRRTHTHA